MNLSIFKAYDIRGIYPTEINKKVATEVGQACAKLFRPGKIIIAHDIRYGSVELSNAVAESIMQASNGRHEIVFVGPSTTPMFYFLVNDLGAMGGCMVTASHNPKDYNGFKIVEEKARMVSGTTIRDIIAQKS
jgi:phosphomannomutase